MGAGMSTDQVVGQDTSRQSPTTALASGRVAGVGGTGSLPGAERHFSQDLDSSGIQVLVQLWVEPNEFGIGWPTQHQAVLTGEVVELLSDSRGRRF